MIEQTMNPLPIFDVRKECHIGNAFDMLSFHIALLAYCETHKLSFADINVTVGTFVKQHAYGGAKYYDDVDVESCNITTGEDHSSITIQLIHTDKVCRLDIQGYFNEVDSFDD